MGNGMIRRKLSSTCGARTFKYPAMVFADVGISDMAGNPHPEEWPALVDTGADRTAVPLSACHDLGISPRDWRHPTGFDPSAPRSNIPLYYVQVSIKATEPIPLLVYGVRRDDLLLGRDFLSRFLLAVDPRTETWELGKCSICKSALLRI